MAYLDAKIEVRLKQDHLDRISKLVEQDDGERWDGASHFIRSAVLKLLREEEKKSI